jgi:tetratricopeptide (TPR) repeat protein
MKHLLVLITGMFLPFYMCAQSEADSLKIELAREKIDTNKVKLLRLLAQAYQVRKPDTSIFLATEALMLSRKHKYIDGESRSLGVMANAFNRIGNYPKALQLYIEKLKLEETRKDPENLAVVYMNIATVYLFQHEYIKALEDAYKADSILLANQDLLPYERYKELRWTSLLNLGDIFEKSNQLDSAMEYTNRAYRLAAKTKDIAKIGPTLNNLGNICLKNGSLDLAIENYQRALPFLYQVEDEECICETAIGLARAFEKSGMMDSALYYARLSYSLSKKDGFLGRNLDASSFLHSYFAAANNIDSAYKYQSAMMEVKDSIQSVSRIKEAQIISMDEQLRQKELYELKIRERDETNKRLQFLLVGVMVPIIILAGIYFKGTKVKPSIVEVLGIVSLLLFFECISLLLHPTVVEITNHIPVLELLVFAVIATLLSRMHHRIERWVLTHLTHRKERMKELV